MYVIVIKHNNTSIVNYFAGILPIIDSNEKTVVVSEDLVLCHQFDSIEKAENRIDDIKQNYKTIMKEPIANFTFEIHELIMTTNKVK